MAMAMAIPVPAPLTHIVHGARSVVAIQGDWIIHRERGLWVRLAELFWRNAGAAWIPVEHATVHLLERPVVVLDWWNVDGIPSTLTTVYVHCDGAPWQQVDGVLNPMIAQDFAGEVERLRLRKRALER